MFPNYTIRERVADGCIHVIGVTASLVALTALLVIGVQVADHALGGEPHDLRARSGRHLQLAPPATIS